MSRNWKQWNWDQDFLILVFDFVQSVEYLATAEWKHTGFEDEIGLSLECSYKQIFISSGDRAPYAMAKTWNSETENPGSIHPQRPR